MTDTTQTARSAPTMIPAIADDGTLFPIEKMAAHRSGQLHLAISVFVFSPAGKLLIQQRAASKYHCGGQWANTCCSHPHWGEGVGDAAARRLGEELGFACDLTPLGEVTYRADVGQGLIEHEHVHMYAGHADPAKVTLDLNPSEVDATKWVTLAELDADMRAQPQRYTPWFRLYTERWQAVWAPAA